MAFNISYAYQAIDKFSAVSARINKSVERTRTKFRRLSQQMQKTRADSKGLGNTLGDLRVKMIAAAAIGFAAIKSYTGFEDALLGVAKTANIKVGPELDKFGDRFTELSLKIPISSQELLHFGKSAAQLGVKGKKNILLFSGVMGKLVRTTDIVGEQGAASLARLITVTDGSMDQVGNYASALVDLGNTSAATEAEILHFATTLASRTAVFGIAGTQALGLAAALASLGVPAELGASAVGRGLGAINKSILKGGGALQMMSQLTGIAGKDLKEAFGKDPMKVLQLFGGGLEKFEAKGHDVTQMLAAFGLQGQRDLQVLGLLAKHNELVTEKIIQSAKAFKENIALNKEFAVQMGSLSSKMKILWNHAKKLLINLVGLIRPLLDLSIIILTGVIKAFNGFINQFPILSRFLSTAIVVLIGLKLVMIAFAIATAPATAGLIAFAIAFALSPIGLAIIGIGALIALYDKFKPTIDRAINKVKELWAAFLDFVLPKWAQKLFGVAPISIKKLGVKIETTGMKGLETADALLEKINKQEAAAAISKAALQAQQAATDPRLFTGGDSQFNPLGDIKRGVAAESAMQLQSSLQVNGNININDPGKTVKSADMSLKGITGGDLGFNMAFGNE